MTHDSRVVDVTAKSQRTGELETFRVSRRKLLLQAVGSAGIAAATWFLPPEMRGFGPKAARAYLPCWDPYSSVRVCKSSALNCQPGCSGNPPSREPYCIQITVLCSDGNEDCETCELCIMGGLYCQYWSYEAGRCCMQGYLCGPCEIGGYDDDCTCGFPP